MQFLSKYKFINRLTKIPRRFLFQGKKIGLNHGELDLITKLLNFSHFSDIKPNLNKISNNSGVSLRTYQRSLSKLIDKELLEVQQTKDEKGRFSSNIYTLDKLLKKIDSLSENNQLSLFDTFGVESSIPGGFVLSPVILDSFQNELKLTQKESLTLKILFAFIDHNGISEISLNYLSKNTPLTRGSLTKSIEGLSKKGLIIIKEQFTGKGIRLRNKYDIKPLFNKLNELEKRKVEDKLKEQGKWKDFNKNRTKGNLAKEKNKDQKNNIPKNTYINKDDRINFLENEIRRFQTSLYISKDSIEAQKIREYQKELNELKYNPISNNSLSNLLLDKYKKLKIKQEEKTKNKKEWNSKYTPNEYRKAKQVCDKLSGNWNKNSNFYLKAVNLCENTIDRYVALTEHAQNKERYFLVTVSKVFKKIEQHNLVTN